MAEDSCMAALSSTDRTDRTLLTTEEVADVLRVSTRTVRRMGACGQLERVKFGYRTVRYTPASVETLITPSTSEAPVITPGLRDNSGEDTADAPYRT